MYIHRNIDTALLEWKDDTFRKPLLLRGARQTGKTTAVRHFAKQFESFVELNFEKDDRLFNIFEKDLNIQRILGLIEGIVRQKIVLGKTLLFLDEIQLCPRAVSAPCFVVDKGFELRRRCLENSGIGAPFRCGLW